jgi:hypothetical protein
MQPSPMQPSPLQTSPLQTSITPSRRVFVTGAALTALLAAAGCATQPGYFDIVEAVRRLMQASADRAFARLIAPGGFYDDQVARLNLPAQFEGRAGRIADRILRSNAMRDRMMRSFNDMACRAAERAAPVVADAVRRIGIRDTLAILHGSPTAATDVLHREMGDYLVSVLVPEFGRLLHLANDPLLSEVIIAFTGVDLGAIADDLAHQADGAIWREIGRQEAAIRADPRATNDPVLIRLFGR